MLQQTTVVAVVPYFERFLARFPTVRELASSDESEVLRLWEGLGYYSRARNLRKAAEVVVREYDGMFPADLETLQKLPGIGRYTAGAIASFAFDLRAPIVEANTLRLDSRLLGYEGDPRSKAGQEVLWSFAEAVLPKSQPGRFNQALMELGATVCSPKAPNCEQCPVQAHCRAFAEGTQARIPRASVRPAITEIVEASIAVHRGGKYLLRRCPAGERWAGLWDFVRFQLDEIVDGAKSLSVSSPFTPALRGEGPTVRRSSIGTQKHVASREAHFHQQIALNARDRTGLNITLGNQLAELKHSVTRYRITLKCFSATVVSGELLPTNEWLWVSPQDFGNYPLSVTGRKLARLLASDGGDGLV